MSLESHKNMAVGTDILRLKASVCHEQGCNMWQKCTLHHKTFLCSSVAKSKPTWPYPQELTLEGKQRSTSVAQNSHRTTTQSLPIKISAHFQANSLLPLVSPLMFQLQATNTKKQRAPALPTHSAQHIFTSTHSHILPEKGTCSCE